MGAHFGFTDYNKAMKTKGKRAIQHKKEAAEERPRASSARTKKRSKAGTKPSKGEKATSKNKPTSPATPVASTLAVRKSMQGNKGANTRPELLVRQRLREAGLTGYRLHWKVPGKPDVAWPGKKVALFINGCFWHRHKGCAMASTPKTNVEYWTFKFDRNVERDKENLRTLRRDGWQVHVVWECQLKKGKVERTFARLLPKLADELGKELQG